MSEIKNHLDSVDTTEFSPEALSAAESFIIPDTGRKERVHIDRAYSIDPERAQERDDALSIENGGRLLAITIADTSLINPFGPIALEAIARGETRYDAFARESIPMLPAELSRGKLSLSNNIEGYKAGITALLEISNGSIGRTKIIPTTLDVQGMSYSDAANATGDVQQVVEAAGIVYKTLSDKRIFLADILQSHGYMRADTTIQQVIGYCNIFFNLAATQYAQTQEIPLIYSTQRPSPTGAHEREIVSNFNREPGNPVVQAKMRKILGNLRMENSFSPKAKPHFSLGQRKGYAVFSRPLRSAEAFINLANLSASLQGQTLPYNSDFVTDFSDHLNEIAGQRVEADIANRVYRVQAIIENPEYDLSQLSDEDFHEVIVNQIRAKEPSEIVIQEINRRLDEKIITRLIDLVTILVQPEKKHPLWQESREKVLKRIRQDAGLGRVLLETAKQNFEDWEAGGQSLFEVEAGWESWCRVIINGVSFTLPQRILINSANASEKKVFLLFWQHYIEDSLIQADIPPKENSIIIDIDNGRFTQDYTLPESFNSSPDKHSATWLHVVSSTLGLGVPRFARHFRKKNMTFATTISGFWGLGPMRSLNFFMKKETGTNQAAEQVLVQIRKIFSIDRVTKEAIVENRKKRWRKRSHGGFLMDRSYKRAETYNEDGSLAELKRVCRRNSCDEPHISVEKSHGKLIATCSIHINGKTIVKKGNIDTDRGDAIESACKETLEALPGLFELPEDYKLWQSQKGDISTPLGKLYQIADNDSLDIAFKNSGTIVMVEITVYAGDKVYTAKSGSTHESVAVQNAAYKVLSQFEDERVLESISTPESPDFSQSIPMNYLLMVDPVKELRLLCQERGYKPVQFSVQTNIGKQQKTLYTGIITTPTGEEIVKDSRSVNPNTALLKCATYLLQHFRPGYRTNTDIFERKLELLQELYGVHVKTEIHSELLEGGKIEVFRVEQEIEFEGEKIGTSVSRNSKRAAQSIAAQETLKKFDKFLKWKARAVRKK